MIVAFHGACAQGPEVVRGGAGTENNRRSQTDGPVEPKPGVVDFGPGIRIDYRVPQVEVEGEIILREGPLELFAYAMAPQQKQHESIVLLQSKPQRIYQALGLIGLTPGRTARYFYETRQIRLPTGDPVDVHVRYEANGVQITVSACDWMIDAERGQPMTPQTWLFTGSERFDDGTFFADIEGTVVTVVDFPSSILGLAGQHSDSDADLWVKANTEAIPPDGTPVTLILRPASMDVEVRVSQDGSISVGDPPVESSDIGGAIKAMTAGWTDRASVIIRASETTPAQSLSQAMADLITAGVRAERIKLKLMAASQGGPSQGADSPAASP